MTLLVALGRNYRTAALVIGVVLMSWALPALVWLAYRAWVERKGRWQK